MAERAGNNKEEKGKGVKQEEKEEWEYSAHFIQISSRSFCTLFYASCVFVLPYANAYTRAESVSLFVCPPSCLSVSLFESDKFILHMISAL